MRVLVACEYSGIVRDAFLARGHDAMSCDILPTESPGPHYQGNVLEILNDGWDMMIAHPPCTYLSNVANRVWDSPGREFKRWDAAVFFMTLMLSDIEKICIENPLGIMNRVFRKPDQIIHPYYFGEPYKKRTCLWLKNLVPLMWSDKNELFINKTSCDEPGPLYICQGEKSKGKAINWCEGMKGSNRGHSRSRFWESIASAMATQWG